MGILHLLLSVLVGLAGLACWIITLIKIFQSDDGILHGIIGILCGLCPGSAGIGQSPIFVSDYSQS
jgi:hypothetical protein